MKGLATEPSLSGVVDAAEATGARADEVLDLETLYRAHAPTVARWATRLAGPTLDAEDILHEVFIVAHRRLAHFRGDAKITTWLYAITANVVRHQRRKDRFRRWLAGGGHQIKEPEVEVPTPVDEIERREAIATVYRILDRMGEKYRTALILHQIEGMTGPEIAELLGIKPSTVWVRLHRARAQFAELLERDRK